MGLPWPSPLLLDFIKPPLYLQQLRSFRLDFELEKGCFLQRLKAKHKAEHLFGAKEL